MNPSQHSCQDDESKKLNLQDAKVGETKGMEISSYGVKILPSRLFEEEKKMVGVDLGEDTTSMLSSKTTESVASIF